MPNINRPIATAAGAPDKFNVTVKVKGKPVQVERYYSDIKAVTTGGSACKTFSFANPVVCILLSSMRSWT